MRMVYHLWLSPASRKVRLTLGEKKLEVDLAVEKTWERWPEFLALNPTGKVPVMVEDDGVGFDTEAAMAGPVEARFGLRGMQERMASVGGRVNVESTPFEGTATFITLPLEPEG